jgi:F-type H+-transporting ATPase subunit gamma
MPSTRDIRRRIKSIKSTAQITKAMQMVASSMMRIAQQAALAGRPYILLLNSILARVTGSESDLTHPLLEERPVKKRVLIVVTSDKGLAGGLNTNLFREALKFEKETTVFVAVGRKGSQAIARSKRTLAAEFTYKDAPIFAEARAISKFVQDLYIRGEVDEVVVLFTRFVSTLQQQPDLRRLIPIKDLRIIPGKEAPPEAVKEADENVDYLFEPDAGAVLGALLPHFLNYIMYQVLLEAKASEHSARMVAMKNATDNAKQLIKDLTLEYNKLRQGNITRELLEITSAAMAMG